VRKKTHTSSEAKKKQRKNSYLKGGTKNWRKTHTSSEAQKNGEKLLPQVRHKKVEKNLYLK
jgi:hypothetical protein